jgi:hypothetical protein
VHRAEEKLLEWGPGAGKVKCQVTGASPDAAATINDYVTSLQLLMAADPAHVSISPEVTRTLQLAKLDNCIRKAEQLVARQGRRVEDLAQHGWQHELSTRLLDNFKISLALLQRHRDLVQHELIEAE